MLFKLKVNKARCIFKYYFLKIVHIRLKEILFANLSLQSVKLSCKLYRECGSIWA